MAERDRLPLDPVTLTSTLPAEENVQERVAIPDPVTLVGVMVQSVLLLDSVTTPAKPFTPVTITVEVPAEPALTGKMVGLVASAKSCTR